MTATGLFRRWIGHCDLSFDLAQGGESFDSAQDREPVERPVEPFEIGKKSVYALDSRFRGNDESPQWPVIPVPHQVRDRLLRGSR
jgi:hypothetical protein